MNEKASSNKANSNKVKLTSQFKKTIFLLTLLIVVLPTLVFGKENFKGVTLGVKLIGGEQYETLYTEIPKWEKMTGAKVKVLSRKSHFELDREMKQDMATGNIDWCVGSDHTSFAPQYASIYIDLKKWIPKKVLSKFQSLAIKNSMVNGRLVQIPRHSDISNLFYKKSLYKNKNNQKKFKKKYGYKLAPPKTWKQVKDQAIFFADPPNFYGTQFVGKDEAITGRFYEMLVAEGGAMFDKNWNPTFNSKAGVRALQWFVDLYKSKAVPPGVLNYLWDDTGLGFASGSIALNLDWAGWASFFNDPKNSKVAGDIGLVRAPKGSAGIRTGWSGSHSFSVTKSCDNKKAAVSFVTFLTDHDRQMVEARKGLLPTRTKVWKDAKKEFKKKGNKFLVEVFEVYGKSMAEDAFTPPLIRSWIEVSNEIWPRLQAAILGEKTSKAALDEAAKAVRRVMEDSGYL